MYRRGRRGGLTLVTLLCVAVLGIAGIALVPAPAEAATTVNQCQVINDSNAPADGQVLLGQDVTASGTCIQIATSDVVFDGQGNTITGPGSSGDGVFVDNGSADVSNVTVRNVVVEGFSNGVRLSDAAGAGSVSDVSVSGVTARNNGNIGVYVENDATSGVTVSDTTVSDNLDGVYVAGRASLDGITATNNLEGVVLTGSGSSLSDSTVNGGANGLLGVEVASAGSTVDGVTVDGTGNVGIEVTASGVTVKSSVVKEIGGGPNEVGGVSIDGADDLVFRNNQVVRISAGDGVKVVDSVNVKVAFGNVANVSGSGVNATRVGAPTSVEVDGMLIRGNFGLADDYGVRVVGLSEATVVDNRIRNMSDSGVFVDGSSGVAVRDNDVFDNNRGGDPLEAGIRVNGTDDARIEANTVQRNAFNGVYVTEADGTLILDNEIVDNCGGNRGLGLVEINDTLVAGNNVSANTGTGISVFGQPGSGQNVTIRDGTVSDNGGSGIESSAGVTVDGIVADENRGNGVSVGDGSGVRNVVARDNGGYGVAVDPGSTLDNVTAAGNGNGFSEGDVYADDGTSTATDLTVGENTMTFASVKLTNAALSGLNASTAPAPPSGLVDVGAYVTVSTGQQQQGVTLRSVSGDVTTMSTGTTVFQQYAALSAPDTQRQIALPRFDPVVSYSAPAAADESTLTLYRYNGTAWAPVSGATTDANADTVSASGGTGDYALFAEPASGDDVTGPTGDIEVTDAGLSTTNVETDESVTVTATVENTQGATAAKTLRLRVDGISAGQQTVYVPADTNETYEFTYAPSRTGEFDVTVNGLDAGTLAVSEPAAAGGSSGDTTATATDAAGEGSGGSGAATATETTSGSSDGGSDTATATETASGSGDGGSDTTTETATDDTSTGTAADDDGTPEPTTGGGAGFGAVVALVALLAAALVAVRRR